MPLFEYYCSKCKKTLEIIETASANEETFCPECSNKMKRKISLGSFVLGKGFWERNTYQKTKD